MVNAFQQGIDTLVIMLIIGRSVRYKPNILRQSSVFKRHTAYFFTTSQRNALSQIKVLPFI